MSSNGQWSGRRADVNYVVIIGVGIHPFGRFDKSATEMGATAGSAGRPGSVSCGSTAHPTPQRRQS
jgi:hypothetical protein